MVLGEEVVEQFRQLVADTLDSLEERTSEEWSPEADLTPETYLTLNRTLLGEAPLLASEHEDLTFVDALLAPEALPVLPPSDLPARDLELYAITVGSQPGERASFVRRSNPRRGLRAGRLLTSYHDVLARIDAPVFGFDLDIDLILVGDLVHVLSQTTFAKLFRDQETLIGRVPAWTGAVAAHIPMADEGRARLEAKVLRDSRLARRLETIANRGHLEGITTEEIRSKMAVVGLDHEVLINAQGELTLEEEHIPSVLHFLNEDLFHGVLTNAGFRADRKAPR
ncbi:hypothetical protein [Nocardioides pakistanensis]